MSKVQELGQAVQELTLHKHQLNMQKKELADRNNELEHILAQGEMKLRNLARQLTKSVGEQERLATKEAELRMELQKAQYRA
jgi:regulator of replication initiation timing